MYISGLSYVSTNATLACKRGWCGMINMVVNNPSFKISKSSYHKTCRDAYRTNSDIQYEAFCKKSQQPKVPNYFFTKNSILDFWPCSEFTPDKLS